MWAPGLPLCSLGLTIFSHAETCGSAKRCTCEWHKGPELTDANNTDRYPKIFPLEYPLVKVSIGTRKPLRFTPDIERIDLTSFRITVQQGQVRAIFSADEIFSL